MSAITTYTYTLEKLTTATNGFKEIFVERMVQENVITPEIAEKMNKYVFVMHEKGYFGKLWDRMIGLNDGYVSISIVKPTKIFKHENTLSSTDTQG